MFARSLDLVVLLVDVSLKSLLLAGPGESIDLGDIDAVTGKRLSDDRPQRTR